jgi:HlyD family secretion protein
MTKTIPLCITLTLLAACDAQDANQRIVGQLESDRIEITAEVAEPIIERPVIEGQSVTAGTLLIRQDTSRIESRIAEAKASELQARARLDELIRGPRKELIVAAQANVQGAKDELEFRETDLARAQEVFERNLASSAIRDRVQAARDNARAQLESLQANLEELLTGTTPEELRQAEEAVSRAAARIASLTIDLERHSSGAPVDSVVDSLLFEVGERPAIGQPIAILLSGRQPYARVSRIFVDGLEEALDGRVRWVASESAFTPYFALTEHDRGRLSYVAKVDVLNRDERLPDGVPVEVELLIDGGTE